MFDEIISHLATADAFEWNAKRLIESGAKPPNWAYTCIECLGDASRERAVARDLAVAAHTDSSKDDSSAESAEGDKRSGDIRGMTLGQLLRLAAVARSASGGSKRMRQSTQRMSQVAALLQTNKAMPQLLWWCGDVEPVPPGRPVIDTEEREQVR